MEETTIGKKLLFYFYYYAYIHTYVHIHAYIHIYIYICNCNEYNSERDFRRDSRTDRLRNVLKSESIKMYLPIPLPRDVEIYDRICRCNSRGRITTYKFKFISTFCDETIFARG